MTWKKEHEGSKEYLMDANNIHNKHKKEVAKPDIEVHD